MQPRPTVATIDLAALDHNLEVVRQHSPGAKICAVVKADAYGHGMVPIAQRLESRGVEAFGVALVEEGLRLRAHGITRPILVWAAQFGGDNQQEALAAQLQHRLTPVLCHPSQVALLAAAVRDGAPARCHVELDLGMARNGLSASLLPDFIAALKAHPKVHLEGLMGHLSAADDPDKNALSQSQARVLAAAQAVLQRAGLPPEVVHLANSAAAFRLPFSRLAMVRPGLALWGLQPSARAQVGALLPVLRLTSRLTALREVATGSPVSYGCLWRAPRPSRIGTLAIGYADGFSRRLSGRAQVLLGGRRVPVVGTICMDYCMVDVTDHPTVALGDEAVLLGRQGEARITAEDWALLSNTISYEILCALGPRLRRVYVDGPLA